MEVIALDVEGGHLRLGDLDALGIGVGVEFAGDGEAGRRGLAAISSTTARRLVSGRPRQVCVMWQKRRCSILFHFDVPGG